MANRDSLIRLDHSLAVRARMSRTDTPPEHSMPLVSSERGAAARRARTPGTDAQQRLLHAADELFYREGVRSVGVDAIVERAGMNKMSLYRQFSSKDDLVVAYLLRAHEHFLERVEASIAKHPDDPARQITQCFEDLAERASVDDYRGCAFVNASGEFCEASHPVRQCIARCKAEALQRLTALATAAGADDPRQLGEALALVLEGVYAASRTYAPGTGLAKAAPRLVARLVAAACARPAAGKQEA
jgi:AcrR family transcriptional regulator